MPILVDSFHVMRGSKKDSHLPDIDRDSCYHIHNISKKFCEPFNVICGLTNSTQIYILTLMVYRLKRLFTGNLFFNLVKIYAWEICSTSLVVMLRCFNLNLDLRTIFYFAFLKKENKICGSIMYKIQNSAISKIQNILSSKKLIMVPKEKIYVSKGSFINVYLKFLYFYFTNF